MAGLAQLKFAMGSSIFLVAFVFAVFLSAIMLLINSFVIDIGFIETAIIVLLLTIIFILFQYLIGPAIVKASTRLQYLKPGENPWLETTVKDLADKSQIPMPKLAVVPDNTPNAFVFGRTGNSATLAVHEGLLRNLNENEVKSVIGHELGHLKHKDYIVMTIIAALPLVAYLIARGTWQAAWLASGSSRNKNESSMRMALVVIGVASYVVYFITLLLVMRLSRLREHFADAYSAYVTGQPRNLESALAKITYGLSLSSKPPSGARTFYIGDPAQAKLEVAEIMQKKNEYDLDHDGVLDEHELELAMEKEAKSTWTKVNSLFTTHPPTFKRILLLQQIDQEIQNGKFTSDHIYTHV